MQFIPSSWAVWGRDGDGDGRSDPSDIDDAALATAVYLCAGDRDLTVEKDRRGAVFSYNHSWDYVDLVLAWADAYATGTPPATVHAVGAARRPCRRPAGPGGRAGRRPGCHRAGRADPARDRDREADPTRPADANPRRRPRPAATPAAAASGTPPTVAARPAAPTSSAAGPDPSPSPDR